MKKSLLALAILGAFAGAASAQSSVTIYGIADVGLQSFDTDAAGASRTNSMISGGQSASRIGFKGTEDLGGGLKANFVLENGYSVDSGVGGAGFNRVATVGLQGGFGAVTLGKQASPFKEAHDAIDPFGAAGATANIENIFYNNAVLTESGRPSNTIKYASPKLGGFSGKVSYTFGEAQGENSANRQVGLNLGYAGGPVNVQFGYLDRNVNATTAPFASTADIKAMFLGATYNFGVAKLHAAFANTKNDPVAAGPDLKYRNGLIGVTVPFGASAVVASYAVNDNRTIDDADTKRIALMYTYDLSKRTNIYTGYAVTKNDANARLVNGGTAANNGLDPKVFNVGVRHKF